MLTMQATSIKPPHSWHSIKTMKILCIFRAHQFSPASIERDAHILQTITQLLQEASHDVVCCKEEELSVFIKLNNWDYIVSMARSEVALRLLSIAEKNGSRIFNSPSALLKTNRVNLTKRFLEFQIPMPETILVEHPHTVGLKPPYWIKKGGAGAKTKDDVVFIKSEEDRSTLPNTPQQCIAVSHAEGDLIKFYGVAGTDFFQYHYPTAQIDAFSKFGLESINGTPNFYDFELSNLKTIALEAAKVSGFDIFGGDAIITADGQIKLIDFNDFPSFANCREAAAGAVVQLINLYGKQPANNA